MRMQLAPDGSVEAASAEVVPEDADFRAGGEDAARGHRFAPRHPGDGEEVTERFEFY